MNPGDRVALLPNLKREGTAVGFEGSRVLVLWDDGLGPYRCAATALGRPGDAPIEQTYTVAAPKPGAKKGGSR